MMLPVLASLWIVGIMGLIPVVIAYRDEVLPEALVPVVLLWPVVLAFLAALIVLHGLFYAADGFRHLWRARRA